jgi:hypothetical protein
MHAIKIALKICPIGTKSYSCCLKRTHKDYEPVKIIKKNEIIYGVHKKRENILDENARNAIKTVTIRSIQQDY